MSTLITVIHVVTCVFLVLFVLVQSGKGAEISASFGGSSQTVFGSSGGANFFVKITGVLAAVFFTTSLVLTIMGGQARKSLFEASPFSAAPPAATTTTNQSATAPTGQAPAQPGANTSANTAPNGATNQNAAPQAAAPAQGSAAATGAAPAPAAPAKH